MDVDVAESVLVAGEVPEPAHRRDQPQPEVGVGVDVPVAPEQGGVDVASFVSQGLQPAGLAGSAQPALAGLGELRVVMSVVGGQPVTLSGVVCAFGGVLPQGLQHPEPAGYLAGVGVDQRAVHQLSEQVQDIVRRQRLVSGDRFRRLNGPAAAEHGEPPEQDLLRVGEQLVAPVHGGAQRLLTGLGGAGAAGEQPEPVVEAGREFGEGQGGGAGRGQLQGQRQPVQLPADPTDLFGGVRVDA